MVRQLLDFPRLPLKGLFLLAFFYTLTRKRVHILFYRQLFFCVIFPQLIPDIPPYRLLISSYRADIVTSTPKMSVPLFIFQIRVFFEYHQTAFSLQVPHYLRYTVFRWDWNQHMYMIFTCFCLQYLHFLICTQFPKHRPYVVLDFSVDYLSSIFYFGAKTMWYLHSHVVCAKLLISSLIYLISPLVLICERLADLSHFTKGAFFCS